MDWISFFTSVGSASIALVWIPLGIWTIAALPLFLLSRLLSARQPVIHYQSCIALLLSLPLGFLFMPFANFEAPTASLTQDISTYLESYAVAPSGPTQIRAPEVIPSSPPTTETVSFNTFTGVGILTLLVALVSFWFCIRLLLKIYLVGTQYSNLEPTSNPGTQSELDALTQSLSIKRLPQLLVAPQDTIPCTRGWRKPVIVIPEGIEADKHALRTTLLHELTHIRRNDYLWGLITRFLASIFTYHPFVHILHRDINTYRELSCDCELINQHTVDPAEYARLLLRFTLSARSSLSISMIQPKSALKRRVASMQRYAKPKPVIGLTILPIVLLIPALFLSCSNGQLDTNSQNSNQIGLKDIDLSFTIQEGWIIGESKRKNRKNAYQHFLDTTPVSLHHIYDKRKLFLERMLPDKTTYGENVYLYTDVNKTNVGDVIEGTRNFYRYELSVRYLLISVFNREQRKHWRNGECKSNQTGEYELCERSSPERTFIRKLDKNELLFNADSGYLFEEKFQYGGYEGMHSKQLIYYFYKIQGQNMYRIIFMGTATDPEHAVYTESESLLDNPELSNMLASIRFH